MVDGQVSEVADELVAEGVDMAHLLVVFSLWMLAVTELSVLGLIAFVYQQCRGQIFDGKPCRFEERDLLV